MCFSLHMIFSLGTWCCLGYPGKSLEFGSFVKDDCSEVLEVLHCFWPLAFYLDFSLEPFGLFVITFVLSGFNLHFVPLVVVSRRSTRAPASSLSSAFTTSYAKRKLVISRPPMLILPSWSSNASHLILSRKMLKRVGENRHPCRTPTVVLNQSPVLPLNRTALWALSCRLSMTRMMLALML